MKPIASIGPRGIEIAYCGKPCLSPASLQLDQEELKSLEAAGGFGHGQASIGPRGIEILNDQPHVDLPFPLQLDQEELKLDLRLLLQRI